MKTYNCHFATSDTDNNTTIEDSAVIKIFSTENVLERTGGLLKLPKLDNSQGLLINKCNSIHTFGMKYALDIIYLDRNYKIVKLVKSIKPRRMSMCWYAKHTLEMLSGEINHLSLVKNMTLELDNDKTRN